MSELLIGRHAVLEALRANRRHFYRLWIEGDEATKPRKGLADLIAQAQARHLPVRTIRGGLFDKLRRENRVHQGIALETGAYPYADLDKLLPRRQASDAFLLLLDHLQDPQNLGTLFRSAEAFGVDGVVIPDRRAAGITPAVCNASAGAVEHLRIARVKNLNRTIDELKRRGVWVAGLDADPHGQLLHEADLSGPLALVVGGEGSGLSRLTREKCDFTVRIPMVGRVESLNAAVAGSIALHWARQCRSRSVMAAAP